MTTTWEMYKKLDTPEGLELCPCCGSSAKLWQYSKSADAPTSKVVCCANGEQFGPQEGIVNDGCLLYMPPDDFYRATMREAAKYWNEYAKALTSQQRARAALANAEPAGWQAIETAPEGTMILCANMKAMDARSWAYVAWIAGGKVCGHRMDMPTHWTPLPTPPKDTP